MDPINVTLTPLDNIMPRRYVPMLFFFPIANPNITAISQELSNALQSLFTSFPALSGTVQELPASDDHDHRKGKLKIGLPRHSVADTLTFADLTRRHPELDYRMLKRRNFPIEAFDFQTMFSSLLSKHKYFVTLENPVMVAQGNFVPNGLILAGCFHHSFMDGLGQVEVMKMWAALCRGEDIDRFVKDGPMDRGKIDCSGEAADLGQFAEYYVKTGASKEILKTTRSWKSFGKLLGEAVSKIDRWSGFVLSIFKRIFSRSPPSIPSPGALTISAEKEVVFQLVFFSRTQLDEMKRQVTQEIKDHPDRKTAPYVSTQDVLSAFLFLHITRAKQESPAGNKISKPKTLHFAETVSGRKRMNPPLHSYVGNVSLFAHLRVPSSVAEEATSSDSIVPTLAHLSQSLRLRILSLTPSRILTIISTLHHHPDISQIEPSCREQSDRDHQFMITSLSGQHFSDLEWGPAMKGSRCERVRIPNIEGDTRRALDGIVIILPEVKGGGRAPGDADVEEGGLEVLVWLEKGAMDRLKGMEEWNKRCRML